MISASGRISLTVFPFVLALRFSKLSVPGTGRDGAILDHENPEFSNQVCACDYRFRDIIWLPTQRPENEIPRHDSEDALKGSGSGV